MLRFICLFRVTLLASSFLHHSYIKSALNRHWNYELNSSSDSFNINIPEWYSFGDCQVLVPEAKVPRSIIHFIGGFLAGGLVEVAYSELLGSLSRNGHLIVATSIPVSSDHLGVATNTINNFNECYNTLLTSLVGPEISDVPIIGLSHSLGGKLTAIFSSDKKLRKLKPRRIGNVYLAFNNYDMKQSMDLSKNSFSTSFPGVKDVFDTISNVQDVIQDVSSRSDTLQDILKQGSQFLDDLNLDNINTKTILDSLNIPRDILPDSLNNVNFEDINASLKSGIKKTQEVITENTNKFTQAANDALIAEFIPSREETWSMISNGYNIQKNVIFKFINDEIDESYALDRLLRNRGCDVILLEVPGTHLTPNLMSLETSVNHNTIPSGQPNFLRYLPMAINKLIEDYETENIYDLERQFILPGVNNDNSRKGQQGDGDDKRTIQLRDS